ncbi:MAG TPA: hypothetical protein VEJ18_14690 [Planctomycetota bacterium]|nr:hypothetical protein [Planctomycetota bacterium]
MLSTLRQYRVETVQDLPRQPHLDAIAQKTAVRLTRLEDGQSFQLKVRRSPLWKPGEVVSLEDGQLAVALWSEAG